MPSFADGGDAGRKVPPPVRPSARCKRGPKSSERLAFGDNTANSPSPRTLTADGPGILRPSAPVTTTTTGRRNLTAVLYAVLYDLRTVRVTSSMAQPPRHSATTPPAFPSNPSPAHQSLHVHRTHHHPSIPAAAAGIADLAVLSVVTAVCCTAVRSLRSTHAASPEVARRVCHGRHCRLLFCTVCCTARSATATPPIGPTADLLRRSTPTTADHPYKTRTPPHPAPPDRPPHKIFRFFS